MHDTTDEVWNRALDYETEFSTRGDIALRDVLTFHGSVENSGLLNAVESYADDDEFPLPRILGAYRYFGLDAAVALISECTAACRATDDDDVDALERLELHFDPQYSIDDAALTAALAARLATFPDDFEPIT